MENILDLVIYPAHVANGSIKREEIAERIKTTAENCELTPLEKFQFCKSIEKAVSAVLKAEDEDGKTIADLALEQALTLDDVKEIIRLARAEELKEDVGDKKKKAKKTFGYNGCSYKLKETITMDFSSNPQKYNQPECVDWRNQLECVKRLDEQMEILRSQQAVAKAQMELDEKIYFKSHPNCDRTIKQGIVVP